MARARQGYEIIFFEAVSQVANLKPQTKKIGQLTELRGYTAIIH